MSPVVQGAEVGCSRTRLRYRVTAAVALALTVAVVLGIALRPAAAAQLPLRPAAMTSVSVADRCTPTATITNGVVTSAKATTVSLTGLGDRCAGRAVALTLFGAGGAVLTTVRTTLAGGATGSATVTVPVYSPSAVSGAAVTIGTWGVPATWTYSPPTALPLVSCTVLHKPSKTCTAIQTAFSSWSDPSHYAYYLQFRVESQTVTRDDEWEITINLADPSLRLLATHIKASDKNVIVAPGWNCSMMPLLVLRGKGGSQYVGDWLKAYVGLAGTSVASQDPENLIACP